MIPAYALTGLFVLVWSLQMLTRAGEPTGRKSTNRFAAGGALGLGVMGLAISIGLPILLPVFSFPHPSGSHTIGTLTYRWVDAARSEVHR